MTFDNPSGNAEPQPNPIPGPQFSEPAQPWGAPQPMPGFAPEPAPKKSRTGLIAGVSAVAVIAVAVGVYAATSGGSNKPAGQAAPSQPAAPASPSATASASSAASSAAVTIVVPASADGLTQMTGSAGRLVTDAMKKADASNATLAGALFGAYAKSGSKTYYNNLTLVPVSGSSALQDALSAGDPATVIGAVVEQTGLTDTATETSPVQGGAISCGIEKTSQITLRMCMWIDADEYGLAAFPQSLSNAAASAYSDALWQASEQS